MIFHLTVNSKGIVSLWDTPRDAIGQRIDGEVVVNMKLTARQEADIARAQAIAWANAQERV